MKYKSYSDLSRDIKNKLPMLCSEDFDLVVGIPRSGMIPAYMIAFDLNINCTSVESFIKNDVLSHGITRTPSRDIKYPWDAKKILLVDDSIKSGNTLAKVMDRLPESLRSKVTTLAIYSDRGGSKKVDMFIEYLPWPRLFEWNILHHSAMAYYCFSIDGVLCEEVKRTDAATEDEYRHRLLTAKPLIIPNKKIQSLVTNRLEKYRLETETWLALNNVQYDKLVMLNHNDEMSSNLVNIGIKHKANYYKKTNAILFIEKDPIQSKNIAKLTLKPVYCSSEIQMHMPNAFDSLKRDPKFIYKELKRMLKMVFQLIMPQKDQISSGIKATSKLKI